MDKLQVKEIIIKTVSDTVNAIADNQYEKLEGIIDLHPSWYKEGQDIKDAIDSFKWAIETNYNGWAEDEGKPFIINRFTTENSEDDFDEVAEQLLNTDSYVMAYNLKTVDNDPDYFWLEIELNFTEDNKIKASVNINF